MNRYLLQFSIGLLSLWSLSCVAIEESNDDLPSYGKLIEVDGRNLHINCLGSGRPVVVFDSGLGGFSMDWLAVQGLLMGQYTVCAYDRAGYGWSDEGPSPRVTDQIVDEFYELLTHAELEPPYILVGHSFGGFNAQYFSKLYPSLVAGLVLVESSHPDQFNRFPDLPIQTIKSQKPQRLMTMFDASIINSYPEQYRILAGRILSSDKSIRTQQREFLNFTQSAVQVGEISRQLDVPLAVITRGSRVWKNTPYGDQQEQIWKTLQQELLSLTTNSWQVIANDSGHSIQLEKPELVANTISQVIDQVCDAYPEYTARQDNQIAMCEEGF